VSPVDRGRRPVLRIAQAAAGALAARVAWEALQAVPPGGAERWARTNHRGEGVTLLEGPAFALAAALAAGAVGGEARVRAAALVAAAGAGAFGAYDDLTGSTASKGFRGHLGALRRGEVTSGLVKIGGIGATGLVAGALLREGLVDRVLAGGVVAGSANLVNLFDLRPGRALKAGLVAAAPIVAAGGPGAGVAATTAGAAAALLPEDLGERSMLGDAGANALGALAGTAFAAGASRRSLGLGLAALVALTAASERVSYSRVIDGTPPLAWLDRLGRQA
jgi:UDP-GlcNAc:undecaprenyl-phosphate GlcNAc-1-phosphate transferase